VGLLGFKEWVIKSRYLLIILLVLLWFEFGYRQSPKQNKQEPVANITDTVPELIPTEWQVSNEKEQPKTLAIAEHSCLPKEFDITDGRRFLLDIKPKTYEGEFSSQLSARIEQLLASYERFIGKRRVRNFKFKIFFGSPRQFDNFMTSRGFSGSSYQGIYFPGGNVAFVKVVNTEQALKTATHEITHAINAQLFGTGFPRFLNEGLAEHFEHYSFEGSEQDNKKRFNVIDYWSKETARDELLDFYTLIHSEQDWHTTNNLSLYFSGALWTQFLMSKPLGLKAISELLKNKADSPCSIMTADDIADAFVQNYPDFEQDFYYFFDELISQVESE
jgi:hypothetical protein